MDTHGKEITADLARAARALAQVSAGHLASQARLDEQLVRDFEHGRASLTSDQNRLLRHTLEVLGVDFLPEDRQYSYGVRRRHSARGVGQMVKWENEGGPAADDDL
ncbi:hypothetical protein [Micrococcus sp. IITD107]|uniref:hypothetical protein n=1 Tax=Micrococcus sp. IITD107 TaxID=3342790 RepID=UPI0035B853E8